MFSLGGGSDAKTVDEQSAAEAGITMLADALAGGHLIHDCGYLESGLTGSLVQLAICDEPRRPTVSTAPTSRRTTRSPTTASAGTRR